MFLHTPGFAEGGRQGTGHVTYWAAAVASALPPPSQMTQWILWGRFSGATNTRPSPMQVVTLKVDVSCLLFSTCSKRAMQPFSLALAGSSGEQSALSQFLRGPEQQGGYQQGSLSKMPGFSHQPDA